MSIFQRLLEVLDSAGDEIDEKVNKSLEKSRKAFYQGSHLSKKRRQQAEDEWKIKHGDQRTWER